MKRVKLERQPEEARDLGRRLGARGIDADAVRHRLDPDLPAGDDPWRPSSCHTCRPVRAEVAEAHGREMEVIRLRDREQHSERAGHVVEVLETLERDAARFEVVGQAVAGEDAGCGERNAAVREAVARVRELSEAGDIRALARLAADRTGIRVPELRSPPVRS